MSARGVGAQAPRAAADLPGPRGRWLSGNLEDFDRDRLGFLVRARNEYGDLVRFDRRTTIINDVGLARVVLKGPDSRFQITENFVQRKLTSSEIESILSGRMLLNPGLRRSLVAGIRPLVAQLTVEALAATGGRPVDPVPVLERVTSHAVAAYYFGPDGDILPAACGALLDALSEVIGNPFALPPAWRTSTRRRIDRLHRELLVDVSSLLERRRRRLFRYHDGAAAVVRAAAASTAAVPGERLANLVVGAMLAAHRVPAAAAGWLLMLLADHPAELERVRADTGPAGSHGTSQVHACVLESLRLYPPTWLLSRRSATEAVLAGRTFPRGHQFVISPFVLGRDERLFPDADRFDPSRWSRMPATAPSLPFGSGPHGCPGSHLATTALTTIATVAASGFDLERCPGEVTPDARTTLLPRGLRLRFAPVAPDLRRSRPSSPERRGRTAATQPAG